MMHLLLTNAVLYVSTYAAPVTRPVLPQGATLDTTVAVTSATNLTLDLRTGGSVRITGGGDKVVRVRVTEGGRVCADCRVELEQTSAGIQLRSHRTALNAAPAQLRFEIEVPNHFNLDLASAGGEVEIEGVDGEIKGQTQSGALNLRRLSGAVDLQTMRGDVTMRESYVSGRVRTMGGKVLLEDVTGTVDGSSQDGKVIERRVTRPAAQ
jgi:DUF4097 and DUF4098 domain-containing protein YvlB